MNAAFMSNRSKFVTSVAIENATMIDPLEEHSLVIKESFRRWNNRVDLNVVDSVPLYEICQNSQSGNITDQSLRFISSENADNRGQCLWSQLIRGHDLLAQD